MMRERESVKPLSDGDRKVNEEEEDTDTTWCPICLNQIEMNKSAYLNKCQHRFCYDCIKRWTKKSRTMIENNLRCPTCRENFREIFVRDDDFDDDGTTKEEAFLSGRHRMKVKYRHPPMREKNKKKETMEERKLRRMRDRADLLRIDFSDDDDWSDCEEEESAEEDRDLGVDDDDDDEEDNMCHICREYDADDDGILLICDGCERNCHPFCVGLDMVPSGDFLCPSCHRVAMRHANVRFRTNDEFQRRYLEFYTNRRMVLLQQQYNTTSASRRRQRTRTRRTVGEGGVFHNNNNNNSNDIAIALSSSEDDE